MISQADLEAATGLAWGNKIASRDSRESPGLHPRHYAPRTPFYVLEPGESRPTGNGRVIDLPRDPNACAATLYAELHNADAEGWDWIAVEKPPDMPEWAGILDRIQRAATRKA
jgi:L-threonylcarbamoyladenylate synthase